MSIKISTASLMGPLWSGSTPSTKPNGLLLDINHQTPAEGAFTCVAFCPTDNTRFVVGDSTGTVYHVLMKKNKFLVAARLSSGAAVTAIAYLSETVVMAASAIQLHVIDLDHGRVEQRLMRTPHTNQIHKIIVSPFKKNFAITVSSDCVALWQTAPLQCSHHTAVRGFGNIVMSFSNFIGAALGVMTSGEENDAAEDHGNNNISANPAAITNATTSAMVVTVEAQGFLTMWAVDEFKPIKRVDIAPFKPTALTVCESFIVVGTKQGKLLCFSSALDAISSIDLPGGSPITDVRLIDGQVIACQTASGHAWFVSTRDYTILFTLSYPSTANPKALVVPDATYSAIVTAATIYVHHLPTAKAFYDRTITGTSAKGSMVRQNVLYPFARNSKEKLAGVPTNSSSGQSYSSQQEQEQSMSQHAESVSVSLPRQVLKVEEAQVKEWIKVNLVAASANNGVATSQPQTLLLVDAIKGMNADDVSSAYRKGGASSARSTNGVGTSSAGGGGTNTAKSGGSGASAHTSSSAAKNRKAQEDEAAVISLRGFLDHDSRVVNMDKLRALLLRYGTFPERYRPLIWRFLLQLPEKRFMEAQFVNLTSRGPHPAVRSLMAPFPLPDTKLRNILYNTLSALAWHSPVFSAVHFIPNIVFPFVKLFSSDVQSSVEVLLAFLINWGQEFFLYYPHPPVSVVSFVAHTLKFLCPELHEHFAAHGVGTDVYVWDVMCSLYTEILTRNEWLQAMDHAFANEPVWLLLFHVCLLAHLKAPLMELKDHAQIVAVLRRATPLNFALVIQNTYQLQRRYVQSDLSHPYRRFNTFQNDAYPLIMECNEVIITTKVRELEKIQSHEASILNMRDRIAHIKKQLVQAAMLEDAFVGKQKAIVASQFEATNDVWVQQVQLEKERQRLRDIEHETRLGALQEQLRSAHRIEAMQREIHAASGSTRDAEVDRQREVMKWDFADRMANQEMDRLEAGARMKLASVIQSAEAIAEQSRQQQAMFAAVNGRTTAIGQQQQQQPEALSKDSYSGVNSSAAYPNHSSKTSQVVPPPPYPHEVPSYRPPTSPKQQAFFADEAAAGGGADEASLQRSYSNHQQSANHNDDAAAYDDYNISAADEEDETVGNIRSGGTTTATTTTTTTRHGSQNPHPNTHVSTSTSSTTPSANAAAAHGSDPIAYYRSLQEDIRRNVEQSQRQQEATLANLNSRYARALLHDDDEDEEDAHTEVTEPICDDVAIDENANNNLGGVHATYYNGGGGGLANHHHPTTATTTTTRTTTTTKTTSGGRYSHNMAAEHAAKAVAAAERYEASVGGDSETTQSSSMTKALLRPHQRGYYTRQ